MKNINFELKMVNCLLLIIVLMIPSLLHAQIPLAYAPSFGSNVSDAPIDGGLSILIVAGVGYGCKKLKDYKNKTKL